MKKTFSLIMRLYASKRDVQVKILVKDFVCRNVLLASFFFFFKKKSDLASI